MWSNSDELVLHVGDWGQPALLGACYKVGFWCLVCLGCSGSWCNLLACWQVVSGELFLIV